MARLSGKEIRDLKLSIQEENVMLQRVRLYVQYGVLAAIVCWIFLLVVFKEPSTAHTVVLILTVISTVFAAFSLISYLNGRKHIIKKMNYLDANK